MITAIIYDKRGKVLSVGKNNYTKTHPMQARYANMHGEECKIYLHAEIDAIIKCRNIKKAHKISVFRLLKNGMYGCSAPCKICMSALAHTPIKIIEHG